MRLTRKQLERKTAYQIDPLMAATVEIVEPEPARSPMPEVDGAELWKHRVWSAREKRYVWRAGTLVLLLALFLPIITDTSYAQPRPVVISTTVQQGDENLYVAEVQQRLSDFGYTVVVDGIFGPQTLGVVLHFQESSGLLADGIVGPITRAALGLSDQARAPAPVAAAPAAAPGAYVHPNPNVQRWYATARAAGWPASLWRWQSCVINRESNGEPDAFNPRGNDESYGLMQINAKAQRQAMIDWAGSTQAFFTPSVNLGYSWHLYQIAGPGPWRSSRASC